MSDRYDYTNTSEEAKEFAKNKLNENPSQVNAHIESLRKWVKSMPHLTCPTDSDFLLKFLRVEKFDHAKAQMRLDNFCTLRSSPRGSPDHLKLFDVEDLMVENYLNMKFAIHLGKNGTGENIVLYRFKVWDPTIISLAELLSLTFMEMNILMMDESTQIFGFGIIMDLDGISRKGIEALAKPKDVRVAYRAVQDSFPMRIKSQTFYNEPAIFDIIFKIINFFMNDKMKRRTIRLSQDIRKAEKQIPGLTKILPKEYHGEGDTIDNITEKWNRTFRNFYKNDHPFANLTVNESKRPQETLGYLADFLDYEGETIGTLSS